MTELDGRVALVTGTAHGIGAAIAAALAAHGATVVVFLAGAAWITGQVLPIDGGHALF